MYCPFTHPRRGRFNGRLRGGRKTNTQHTTSLLLPFKCLAIAALISIALKFGTSIDWLCGISNEPYTDVSVDNAEMRYYEGFRWNHGHIDTSFFEGFNPFQPAFNEDTLQNYSDPVKRHSFYTLAARANILVLLRYPNAISITSKMDNVEPGTEAQSGENKKKRKKYFQVISDMKTILNTGKEIYTIEK